MEYGKLAVFKMLLGSFLLLGTMGCLTTDVSAINNNSSSPKEKVVFVNERQPYTTQGNYDIYIVNYDGTELKKLVGNAINPTPSPDGKKIAFIPIRIMDDHLGISIINIDGNGRKDLIRKKTNEENVKYGWIRWSPDSRKIAYISFLVEKNKLIASLEIVDVATGEKLKFHKNKEIAGIPFISWSNDSKKLMLVTSLIEKQTYEHILLNIETKEQIKLDTSRYSNDHIIVIVPFNEKLLYYNLKDHSLWSVRNDGLNNVKLINVGNIVDILIFTNLFFEVLPNKNIKFIAKVSKDGKARLYEFNTKTEVLNLRAEADNPMFSYSGTMVLDIHENSKMESKYGKKLIVRDLKTGNVYILCSPWRSTGSIPVEVDFSWIIPLKQGNE